MINWKYQLKYEHAKLSLILALQMFDQDWIKF